MKNHGCSFKSHRFLYFYFFFFSFFFGINKYVSSVLLSCPVKISVLQRVSTQPLLQLHYFETIGIISSFLCFTSIIFVSPDIFVLFSHFGFHALKYFKINCMASHFFGIERRFVQNTYRAHLIWYLWFFFYSF